MSKLLQIYEPGQTPLPHQDQDNIAVGIDLGTTHSVVAVAHDHDRVEILRDASGHNLVPSVVSYNNDHVVVGREAMFHPTAIHSIKRIVGKSFDDMDAGSTPLPFHIHPHPVSNIPLVQVGHDRYKTAIEISSEILKTLRLQAEKSLGRNIRQAVITVPAYFDDAARTATKQAAHLAGLDVLRLMNEPTAAALAYGLDSKKQGIFAVYDWGGGTFDVSILRLQDGIFQVLSTGGDTYLGGDDLDWAFYQEMTSLFETKNHESPTLAEIRQCREQLSALESVIINPHASPEGPSATISRDRLEKAIAPWVYRTISIFHDVIKDAGLKPNELDGVILVGGVTRTPFIRKKIHELCQRPPLCDHNPEEVVARGAAIQARILSQPSGEHQTSPLLLDVLPLSLGIETMGGLTEKIIPRNSPIPISRTQEFTTYQDGQTGMKLHVLQGERELAQDCRSLGRFELSGIPPMPAGAGRIAVSFHVDADGLLAVTAIEKTTQSMAHIVIQPSLGMDDQTLTHMIMDGWKHAADDMEQRLLIETQIEGARILNAVQLAMENDIDLINENEKNQIHQAYARLKNVVSSSDRNAITEATQALIDSTHAWAERRMNKALAKALTGESIKSLEQ